MAGTGPWVGRHWALPVVTVLAPSSRYYQGQGHRHKKLTLWARRIVMLLRRWLPHRPLVLVEDNGYVVLDLLHCCRSLREPVTLIAQLSGDAALYAPAPSPLRTRLSRVRVRSASWHHAYLLVKLRICAAWPPGSASTRSTASRAADGVS